MAGLIPREQMERTRALVDEFKAPNGRGQRLHAKLVARSRQRRNWLEEWWYCLVRASSQLAVLDEGMIGALMLTPSLDRLKYAYNIWRCPLPANVSYYFLFDEKVQGPERPDVAQSLVASLCIKGAPV